jgi:hypothetical protein
MAALAPANGDVPPPTEEPPVADDDDDGLSKLKVDEIVAGMTAKVGKKK